MTELIDFFLNLDTSLQDLAFRYPVRIYLLIFIIIFTESAIFPLAPFLPGDGLLFAIGVICGAGALDFSLSVLVVFGGGVLGTWFAYQLGRRFGPWLFDRFSWLNRSHYEEAQRFYEKQGGKAFVLSRFVPVVRALVPLVAGVAGMNFRNFMKKNMISVATWTLTITPIAYFLGQFSFVKEHFTLIIFLTAVISMTTVVITFVRRRVQK